MDRIVITRPAVSVDEQHGFLPGDLKEKMAPWTRPIFDFLEEYYKPKQVEDMIKNKTIEISPLAYMEMEHLKAHGSLQMKCKMPHKSKPKCC